MKKSLALIGIAMLALPTVAVAGPAKAKHARPAVQAVYQCSKCHMKFSAAQAKKDHYMDPMDGGKLVALKSSAPGKSSVKR